RLASRGRGYHDQRLDRNGSYRRNPQLRHVRLDGLKPLQTPGQCLTEPLQVAKHDVRRQIWLSSQLDADRDPKSLATGESKDGTRSRHLAYRTGQILNFTPCGQPQWRVGTRIGDLQQVAAEMLSGPLDDLEGSRGRVAELNPLDTLPCQLGRLALLSAPHHPGLQVRAQVGQFVATAGHHHKERQATGNAQDERQKLT